MKPKDVAAAFRVSTRTLQRWESAGLIRGVRTLGGHRRYRRSDVERAFEQANAQSN